MFTRMKKNRFSFVMGPDASNIKLPTEVDIVKLLDARAI